MSTAPNAKGQRRVLRALAFACLGLVLVLVLGLGLALGTLDRWLWTALDPGPFDASATPAAPDYSDDASWAALPTLDDAADIALPELPAIAPGEAEVAVFYVHPTTWISDAWNVPFDLPEVIEATERGATAIQASVFNGCCRVYAPRYRQVHGRAFTHPDAPGDQARDIAYGDIERAFEAFLADNPERPFILAAHSQGAILATRLLRERIAPSPERERLVVAYLIGAPIREPDLGGVPVCEAPDSSGCVFTYNARGPNWSPGRLEFDADDPATMQDLVCVNPIRHRRDDQPAPASDHAGAVFFDTDKPERIPHFADAQCQQGILVIHELGDLRRDFMSKLLLYVMGPDNYHPVEYQLFYVDLRQDAATRIDHYPGAQ